MELTDQAKAILDLERDSWVDGGSKQAAIRDRLGISATRYYQLLGGVIDEPAALHYDPLLVRRLRRTRLVRRGVRIGGRPIEERSRP